MRKRTINNIYDKIFYGLMYIFPLIIIIISYWKTGDISYYTSILNSIGITNNVFTNAFNTMMINYLHFFENSNNIVLQTFDYMLIIAMCHLLFDIFEYVPKLIRCILKKVGMEND